MIFTHQLEKQRKDRILFSDLNLSIEAGSKLAIVGPNGSGKSTLLALLLGEEEADQGRVIRQKGLRINCAQQEESFDQGDTIEAAIEKRSRAAGLSLPEGLRNLHAYLADFGDLAVERPLADLSGGEKKRLSLILSLVDQPDVLFWDEPTNHLDWLGIDWLETFLKRTTIPFCLSSHDRYFLDAVATSVLEINQGLPNGHLLTKGTYEDHLSQKQELLAGLDSQKAVLQNKLRREEEWLSRGPKARSTKSRYRIEQAGKLQGDLSSLKQLLGESQGAEIDFSHSGRKSKKLIEAEGLGFAYPGGPKLFSGFDFSLQNGQAVGVLGQNGEGKSSFLKVLNGELRPLEGSLKPAAGLSVVYFSQDRRGVDEQATLQDCLSHGNDAVVFQGRSLHIMSFIQKFGFVREQLSLKMSELSGGERAKALIARLMGEQADVLILDEPTNDLDLPTIEELERSLLAFQGAILIVSHDRRLLSRLCSQYIVIEAGKITKLAHFNQWTDEAKRSRKAAARPASKSNPTASPEQADGQAKALKKKLSYKDQREFNLMEGRIEEQEAQLATLQAKLEESDQSCDLTALYEELGTAQKELERLYERWAELESLQA